MTPLDALVYVKLGSIAFGVLFILLIALLGAYSIAHEVYKGRPPFWWKYVFMTIWLATFAGIIWFFTLLDGTSAGAVAGWLS